MSDEKDLEQLGNNLKQARERKNLTQSEVAKIAGIQANYYARIERGEENPSFKIINSIRKALKVKLSEIMPS